MSDKDSKDSMVKDLALEEAQRRGLLLPDEDLNNNLQGCMDRACELSVKQDGLIPMLEIIGKTDNGMDKGMVVFEGIDFSNKKEKLKAMYGAGKKVGEDLGDDFLPMQVTLMSEAWQRTDEQDEESQREVILAATRSWDGREGTISRFTIKDLDDHITDTCPSVESLVERKSDEDSSMLLRTFFLGYAVGAVQNGDATPELQKQASSLGKRFDDLFEK